MVTNILRNRGGGSITTSSNNNTRNEVPTSIAYAKGIWLNIVEVIAQYLTEISLKDFDAEPILHCDQVSGERCYSRFSTADLFSHICEEVKDVYVEDVIPICIQLSFDATDISGGGGSVAKSATPFNIRVRNVSENAFPLQANTILSGFLPQITVSYST